DGSARSCGISQKVLLTMLQKEQHLVATDQPPTQVQLQSAMGLSCPDDADCDTRYAGFFNQVYGAAHRFRYYQAHRDQYAYQTKALNDVRFSPDASCGSGKVYIENDATALLYIYTPYQPNEAALRAGDGEGNRCSSYGNRNFVIIYNSWFGRSDQ
ncbi:MAG: hemagglutinin, partial [Bifidobacterium sp.]|nr:hemagglutinin [Bifidobacterium sp.]